MRGWGHRVVTYHERVLALCPPHIKYILDIQIGPIYYSDSSLQYFECHVNVGIFYAIYYVVEITNKYLCAN